MNRVVVGLGSNILPEENIQKARKILESEFSILKSSEFKRTKPIAAPHHPDFINGVLLLETSFSQEKLKTRLYEIEELLGRPRQGKRSAPRTIDLDILVWNEKIIDADTYTRDFLRQAVLEVLPKLADEFSQRGKA